MSWYLKLADGSGLDWAQEQVAHNHYLHTPVDSRCSVLAYIVCWDETICGCLIFGRPEATRCYDGRLTYGSKQDVANGRAQFDRWEVINLARVWIDESVRGIGHGWLGSWAVGHALKRVVYDYLTVYPPCFLEDPWKLRACLSYCDTQVHTGTLYQAANFQLARTNERGIQTWFRTLRGLQGHERKAIERISTQSYRSRVYRSQRAVNATQEAFAL